jgi:hypothetical protein
MLLASSAEVVWRGAEAAGVADAMIEVDNFSRNVVEPWIAAAEVCRTGVVKGTPPRAGSTGQACEELPLIACHTGGMAGARAYSSPSRTGERGKSFL